MYGRSLKDAGASQTCPALEASGELSEPIHGPAVRSERGVDEGCAGLNFRIGMTATIFRHPMLLKVSI